MIVLIYIGINAWDYNVDVGGAGNRTQVQVTRYYSVTIYNRSDAQNTTFVFELMITECNGQ